MPDLNFSQRQMLATFLVVGLAIGAAATYALTGLDSISEDQAGEKVISTLEQQTDQELELIRVESENELYRVDVRTPDDRLSTFYVTRDGSMLAPENALTDIDRATQVMAAQEDFAECLDENNVVMYGNIAQQETQLQIQLLGGTQVVSDIYRDINDEENLQEAQDRGVERIPGFYLGGSVLEGVNEIEDIEEFTGCNYDIEE